VTPQATTVALLATIRAAAMPHGLNLVAMIPVHRYDDAIESGTRVSAIAPQARSIVVIGNGGGAFWRAFKEHTARNPGWVKRENPLDDFTREIVEHEILPIARAGSVRCEATYPFMAGAPMLNFIELGKLAGIGGPSILGVLVHPTFGPWIAFRVALLVDVEIDAPADALGFDPCPTCASRSCINACPVHVVSYPRGWNIPKCLEHRVEVEADCAPQCHSRVACVLGPEHRYPDDELAYHQMRALRSMRPWYEAHVKVER
jgi:epoxyqueuosine reductase